MASLVAMLCLAAGHVASSQTIGFRPAAGFPMGTDASYFKPAYGGLVSWGSPLPMDLAGGRIVLGAEIDYAWMAAAYVERSYSLAGLGLSLAWRRPLAGPFALSLQLEGGGYMAIQHSPSAPAPEFAPWGGAGLALEFDATPRMAILLGPEYRMFGGMAGTIGLSAGLSWYYDAKQPAGSAPAPSTPKPRPLVAGGSAGELTIVTSKLQDIFPVQFAWYDDHPLGTVRIRNASGRTMTEVKVSLFAKQYMDNPKYSATLASLKPGDEAEVPVFGLFTNRILDESEGSKVSATLGIDYRLDGKDRRTELVQTLVLRDRNAIVWDDDRRAAAFVTAKDQTVMGFAKQVVGGIAFPYADRALVAALAIHEALRLHGISYVSDPASPYATASVGGAVDFLQFPRQTLSFKAGDCDDLSALYCALLEAAGVDTAFITVPGHIYMAVAMNGSIDDASKALSRPGNLVIAGGRAWLPVEVTLCKSDFFAAWQKGVDEWAEASAKGQAALYPVKEAWTLFKPVAFPGETAISPPPASRVSAVALPLLDAFADREIAAIMARGQLAATSGDPLVLNRLGILHARWGRLDKAADFFKRSLNAKETAASLINLGNLRLLAKDPSGALGYYDRAAALDPKSASAALAQAIARSQLADPAGTRKAYDRLKALSPDLAERHSYLASGSTDSARSASADSVAQRLVWEE
jgi:tetratricopeptide (TPR) repeat protein